MYNVFDWKKTVEENIRIQKKFLTGFDTMMKIHDIHPGFSEKKEIYREDKMTVYHYRSLKKNREAVPTLIVYALVNRETMMDLQEGKSFVQSMLEDGHELYIIDWGYPTHEDMYLTMEDYIESYIDNAVEAVKDHAGVDALNLLGVCQGGTLSLIYTALHPEKVNALITMVAPVDFATDDGLLFRWSKDLDIDKMVDAYGVVPGDFMNNGFLTLKPLSLMIGKYLNLIDDFDKPDVVNNFFRMENWIFDSPGQAGEMLRQFVKDLYKENKLVKGELMVGDRPVDLKKVTMPVLNIYAEKDHIVPPAASKPLEKYVASKDVETKSIPTGHIGMYVSSKAKQQVSPMISRWLKEKSGANEGSGETAG